MNKTFVAALAAVVAAAGVVPAGVAAAQPGHDRHDVRDRDRHPPGKAKGHYKKAHRYYGESHGYKGYRGKWRTGQRYSHYRDNRYYISDYRRYDLPPPRAGYRYYREDNGDIVMAAIATGVIALIVADALN